MPISIKLEPEVQKRLDVLAEQEHSSRSRLIQIAILEFLKQNGTNPKTKS